MSSTKFVSDYPELMEQWDYIKNSQLLLDPNTIPHRSGKTAWWLCSKGHSYEQPIIKKTARKYGCTICNNSRIVKGFNVLSTLYPNLALEWHPTKNGELTPSSVSYGSGKNAWWICPIGHEYQSVIRERTTGQTKCPICHKRNQTSFPEQAIFYYVSQIHPSAINRYKTLFNHSMELDIFIPSIRVAIEYDGAYWHQTEEAHKREAKKYSICRNNHIYLIRVKEADRCTWDDVADDMYLLQKKKKQNLQQLEVIIRQIADFVDLESNPWTRKSFFHIHSKIDININRDRQAIQKYLTDLPCSLEDYNDDIIKDWDYEKNNDLKPNMFAPHSNEVVWWKCSKCKNSYKMSINARTRERRSGCPICAKDYRVIA